MTHDLDARHYAEKVMLFGYRYGRSGPASSFINLRRGVCPGNTNKETIMEEKKMEFAVGDLVSYHGNLFIVALVDPDDTNRTYRGKALTGEDSGWMCTRDVRLPTVLEQTSFDPESPLAKYLVGKKVYCFDSLDELDTDEEPRLLVEAEAKDEDGDTREYPFTDELCCTWRFVALPVARSEQSVEEMTVEEVCKALGKTIKIVKG